MQFFNKLSIAVLPNRALLQRATLLNEARKFTLQDVIRGVTNRSDERAKILSSVPQKPKKPLGAYIRYVKLVSPKVTQTHPDSSRREIIKVISEMWRNVDNDTKLKLQNEYLEDAKRYKEEIQSYKTKLTEDQIRALDDEKTVEKKKKNRREMKKKMKELGKPKRPPNAYLLYIQSRKSTEMLGGNLNEWAAKIGIEWTNLPPEEKKIFNEKAKALADKYQNDLFQWESKMDDLGHTNLIRNEKKAEKSVKSKSESTETECSSSSDSVDNVTCSRSKAGEKKKKTTTSKVSNERKHISSSSPSNKFDSNNKNFVDDLKLKNGRSYFPLNEINSKLKKKKVNELIFFLDSYLSDKRTIHIVMGVTFFSVFVALPLFYFIS